MFFRSCFSREAAFRWFVTIMLGIMVHCDSLGDTSIIRNLALDPALYARMGFQESEMTSRLPKEDPLT